MHWHPSDIIDGLEVATRGRLSAEVREDGQFTVWELHVEVIRGAPHKRTKEQAKEEVARLFSELSREGLFLADVG